PALCVRGGSSGNEWSNVDLAARRLNKWECEAPMPDSNARRIVRIGVFYDGHFFSHVSNYYFYHHERRSRISLTGLHAFLREEVARREEVDVHYCRIVDAHYFRGRLAAADAQERDVLMKERQFEDVLVREGVVPHYLPLLIDADGGPRREKGIDVW